MLLRQLHGLSSHNKKLHGCVKAVCFINILSNSTTLANTEIAVDEYWKFTGSVTGSGLELLRSSLVTLTFGEFERVWERQELELPCGADRARGLEEIEGYIWHFDIYI